MLRRAQGPAKQTTTLFLGYLRRYEFWKTGETPLSVLGEKPIFVLTLTPKKIRRLDRRGWEVRAVGGMGVSAGVSLPVTDQFAHPSPLCSSARRHRSRLGRAACSSDAIRASRELHMGEGRVPHPVMRAVCGVAAGTALMTGMGMSAGKAEQC